MSFEPDERCNTYIPIGCHVYINDSWASPFEGTIRHTINHDYHVNFFGVTVPIIKTTRSFEAIWKHEIGPRTPADSKWDGYLCFVIVCSDANPRDTFNQSIKEDCTIEKSTLCYLDHRSEVLLYRYEKQWIKFDKTTTDQCWWKTEFDALGTGKITLEKGDVNSGRTVEWRLVIRGEQTTVHVETDTTFNPFGEAYSVERLDGTMTDPDIVQIFSLPQPPSKAIPYDQDILALEGYGNGLYDYGNEPGEESELNVLDGGGKDMFYPKWCRGLHADPIWREIADNRYNITWNHNDLVTNKVWYPPTIATDPIPKGNHIAYLDMSDLYQFVLPKLNTNEFIVADNCEDITALVRQTLDDNKINYSDQFLLFPFGV